MASNYPYGGASGGMPSQTCQRCGSPLPPNEAYCGNCGYSNPSATTSNPTERASNMSWGNPAPQPQTSYGPNQFSGAQWGQPSVQPVQSAQPAPGNFYNAPSMPQQPFPGQPSSPSYPNMFSGTACQPAFPSSTNNGYGAPDYGTPGAVGAANPYGMAQPSSPNYNGFGANTSAQQGFYASSAPPAIPGGLQAGGMNGYQPGNFNQPPQQKRRSNTGVIIGVVILLVVLVGGGLGGYYYVKHQNKTPAQTHTSTSTPTATPSTPPLFSDTFQNNNSGWDLTSEAGKFSVKVGGGTLVLEDDENRLLPELIPGGKTFSNFRLSFDAVLSKGTQDNGYGIYIRGASNQNSDLATYYRFEIYGDGTYAVFKGTVDANGNSSSTRLVDYKVSPAIQKVGALNHITVTANGPAMTLIVNGQTVASTSDSSYTSGSIALFVSNIQGVPPVAQATFSKLYVYPAQ